VGIDLSNFNWQTFILEIAILVIAITIHEFSHAITADRLGDPTPRSQGRISLLPPDHLDPIGTIFMVLSALVGWGIGWGRPVMTNPRNFQNPRRDGGIVAIAGPVSNVIQAFIFALILRFTIASLQGTPLGLFLGFGMTINVLLAIFNMLPIGPLDGHWVIQSILPLEQSESYRRFNDQYGTMIFLGLVLMAPALLFKIIGPAIASMNGFLLQYVVGLGA
jgi:Zn-dependent protease